MLGLEISEKYFEKYGLPMINEKFSAYKHRIAAGMVGDGSECYGFDDEFSRDHDWGPSFCLWLNKKDYEIIGSTLQEEYHKLPQTFEGYGPRKVSDWGEGRVGVFETGEFYANFIGHNRPPAELEEWLYIPENALAACTNGKVFYDPLGEFTQFRNKLNEFYPEDVRLKKIASRCMTIAQSGQYNFPRCAKRGEYVAALYTEAKFCADTISLVFLLNKEYTPFFKWMHRAVKGLPLLGTYIYEKLLALVTITDYPKKSEIMEEICQQIIKEFKRQRLSFLGSDFLLHHGPVIQKKIKDPNLRSRNVWVG